MEDSNSEPEDKTRNHTFWNFSVGTESAEGRWASGPTPDGRAQFEYLADPQPLTDDVNSTPPPDPKLFATYDGSQGPGKPGDAAGSLAQGAENVVSKVKDALT